MGRMNTYAGHRFDPMYMTPEDVDIRDIAHALSLMCRGGGHLRYFYSVAQHCINCADEARARGWSRRLQLACLLHDASEAYISDIIRPVKIYLDNYLEIEASIMDGIWRHFGLSDLSESEHAAWKQIDDEMLLYEQHFLMVGKEDVKLPAMSSEPDVAEHGWREKAEEFLRLYEEIYVSIEEG